MSHHCVEDCYKYYHSQHVLVIDAVWRILPRFDHRDTRRQSEEQAETERYSEIIGRNWEKNSHYRCQFLLSDVCTFEMSPSFSSVTPSTSLLFLLSPNISLLMPWTLCVVVVMCISVGIIECIQRRLQSLKLDVFFFCTSAILNYRHSNKSE